MYSNNVDNYRNGRLVYPQLFYINFVGVIEVEALINKLTAPTTTTTNY